MSEDNKEVAAEAVAEKPVTQIAKQAVEAAAVEGFKVPETVGANPLQLPWPLDPMGTIKGLKDGVVKSVARIKGDPVKQKKFEQALAVALKYSREKFEVDVALREKAAKNSTAAALRVADKQKKAAQEKVAALQAQIASVEAAYGLKAAPEAE